MAENKTTEGDDSKIIIQLVPSLSRICSVKVAVPLFLNFYLKDLETAFNEIRDRNITASGKYGNDYIPLKRNRITERLSFIPGHLRKGILDAIRFLHEESLACGKEHPYIGADKCFLHLRPDGKLNRRTIARQLVKDKSIDIHTRFHLACTYSFRKKMRNLWSEMQRSGRMQDVDINQILYKFQMPDGSLLPWVQIPPPQGYPEIWSPRLSSYLPGLPQEDRDVLLSRIEFASDDDFLFCLFLLTKEEEEQMLKNHTERILRLHLNWPLQSRFPEISKKVTNFMSIECFSSTVKLLLDLEGLKDDYDYGRLFKDFWHQSPLHLKESVKDDAPLSDRIKSYFNSISRKRKADHDAELNFRKKSKHI